MITTGRHTFAYLDCKCCGSIELHQGTKCVQCQTDRGYDKIAIEKQTSLDYRSALKAADRQRAYMRAIRKGAKRGSLHRMRGSHP